MAKPTWSGLKYLNEDQIAAMLGKSVGPDMTPLQKYMLLDQGNGPVNPPAPEGPVNPPSYMTGMNPLPEEPTKVDASIQNPAARIAGQPYVPAAPAPTPPAELAKKAADLQRALPVNPIGSGRQANASTERFVKNNSNRVESTWMDPRMAAAQEASIVGGNAEYPVETPATFADGSPVLDPSGNPVMERRWEQRSFPGLKSVREQMAGNKQLEDLIRMEDMNLSSKDPRADAIANGLAKFADVFNKTNTANTTYAMQDNAEKRAKILAFMEKLQDNKKDISTKVIDALKAEKSGTFTQSLLQEIRDKAAAQSGGKAIQMPLDAKAIRDVQGKFDKDIEPFNKGLKFADQVDALVKNRGPGQRLAMKTVETILARARGEVGNLSYYEQAGTTVPQDWGSRIEQLITTAKEGKFTPENEQELLGLVGILKEGAKDAIAKYREVHAKQGEQAYGVLGLNYDRFKRALPANDNTVVPGEKQKKQAEQSRIEQIAKKLDEMEKKRYESGVK